MEHESFSDRLVALLPKLRRLAHGLAGSADEGDDLVQGACERALLRSEQFQPGTRFDYWMFSILRNLWIDSLRRRKRQELSVDPGDLADHPGGDAEEEATAKLTAAEVRRAVAALPAEQREALLLVCVEGVGYKRAAEILQLPMGTVTSRVFRARLALGKAVDRPPTEGAQVIRLKR